MNEQKVDTFDKVAQDEDRYTRGIAILQKVGGENYDAPIRALDDIAPALGRFTVEFGYGDVLARPNLDLKTRQICTVAALAALGTAAPQLRYHIHGARNLDWKPEEIVEILILASVYAGFPAALNGITAAREVFGQRGDKPAIDSSTTIGDRYEHGMQTLQRVSRGSGAAVVESLKGIAPDLGRFIIEFSYGDVIGRPGLDDKITELATVAMCTALGTAQPQLAVHINAALNVGATKEEIVEVIIQMAVYAGFPAALNGISVARNVFKER
ncbi:carboxymuconolactone decarboxylase [Ktedonobacter sp. SOSP1-85]|uniref:carboxymuconolactone decarboxylase family protein n=1 Tax=Ktedonobacter sp. SOSP1-85 TaxID=2778367 RepID=UPI001916474D|nr:carboxymuconolactone decarboxylase family protein [Ktedonobacter sp. SOSP1-85]GHO72753.1 carboxymuconolactone decarboxylase [Ktedonobacter sp. SOSP1-85]